MFLMFFVSVTGAEAYVLRANAKREKEKAKRRTQNEEVSIPVSQGGKGKYKP